MSAFSYSDTELPVRADIGEAHRAYWQKLAAPGSYWSGAERVSIAAEVRAARTCRFCAERKNALSPYNFPGEHDSVTDLDALVVDAVHRIVTDQNRITQRYVDDNEARGLSKGAYVELAGIVVAMMSIDEFNRGIGVEPEPLPAPVAGEPDGYVPENLVDDTGFVPMLPKEGNTGNEADLFPPERPAANVLRALSMVPAAVRDWCDLAAAQYLSIAGMANMVKDENRVIDRMQMELVAGRVSSVNECFY